jgi:hypothetical protein
MGLGKIKSMPAKMTVTSSALCVLGAGGAVALTALPAAASSGPTMAQTETPEQTPAAARSASGRSRRGRPPP